MSKLKAPKEKFTKEKVLKLTAADLQLLWQYDQEKGTDWFQQCWKVCQQINVDRGFMNKC